MTTSYVVFTDVVLSLCYPFLPIMPPGALWFNWLRRRYGNQWLHQLIVRCVTCFQAGIDVSDCNGNNRSVTRALKRVFLQQKQYLFQCYCFVLSLLVLYSLKSSIIYLRSHRRANYECVNVNITVEIIELFTHATLLWYHMWIYRTFNGHLQTASQASNWIVLALWTHFILSNIKLTFIGLWWIVPYIV